MFGKQKSKGLGLGGGKKHRKVLRDNIQGITKPAIKRLGFQAGVASMSGLVYEEIRGVIKLYLENLMRSAATYMQHERRNTFKSDDFLHAYEQVTGKKFYGKFQGTSCAIFKSAKGKKTSPGKLIVRKIKHYQKQHGCFMIGSLPFRRVVMEIGQDFGENLRYSKIFIGMVHAATEMFIVDLLRDSFALAVNAKRTTLFAKDIQLARRLKGQVYFSFKSYQ